MKVFRIPAAQISVWLCLEIESLSKAEGPAAGLAHPAATPSCTKRPLYQLLPIATSNSKTTQRANISAAGLI